MPWYIFKKLSPRVTNSQLAKTVKEHIKLKTYNETVNSVRNIAVTIDTLDTEDG